MAARAITLTVAQRDDISSLVESTAQVDKFICLGVCSEGPTAAENFLARLGARAACGYAKVTKAPSSVDRGPLVAKRVEQGD